MTDRLQHSTLYYLMLGLVSACFLLTSCSSYRTVDLNILTPPQYNISDANNVNIVSNVDELGVICTQQLLAVDIVAGTTTKLDGKKLVLNDADQLALEGCIAYLDVPAYFDTVNTVNSNNFNKVYTATVQDFNQQYPSDAIIVLEKISVASEVYNFFFNTSKTGQRELQISTESQWVVYYPNNEKKSFLFTINDTLYWNEIEADLSVYREEALWNNGIKAANKISPEWKTVNRLYFAGENQIIRQANKHVIRGDWDSAAANWLSIYNSHAKANNQKGRMAFNMGLFAESKNKLELALEWIETAETIFETTNEADNMSLCQTYKQIIINRLKYAQELDQIFQ